MKTVLYNSQMLDAVVEDMRKMIEDGKHININYEEKKKKKPWKIYIYVESKYHASEYQCVKDKIKRDI